MVSRTKLITAAGISVPLITFPTQDWEVGWGGWAFIL